MISDSSFKSANKHWRKLGRELYLSFQVLREQISDSTYLGPHKNLVAILRLSALPKPLAKMRVYNEVKSSGNSSKNGVRLTKDGSWHSITLGTALEGRDMRPERLWRLAFAVLYIANVEKPEGGKMALLADLNRSNAYSLLPDLLQAKAKLEAANAEFKRSGRIKRAKLVIAELFRKETA